MVSSTGCSHPSFLVASWSLLGQLFAASLLGALALVWVASFAPAFLLLYCPSFPRIFLVSPLLLLGCLSCPGTLTHASSIPQCPSCSGVYLVFPSVCPPALTLFLLSLPTPVLFFSSFVALSLICFCRGSRNSSAWVSFGAWWVCFACCGASWNCCVWHRTVPDLLLQRPPLQHCPGLR